MNPERGHAWSLTLTMSVYMTLLLLLVSGCQAFYLEGAAPVTYCQPQQPPSTDCQSNIEVFANSLDSVKSFLSYDYNSFDFCKTDSASLPWESLGQVVSGDRIRPIPYKISFLKAERCKAVCQKQYLPGVQEHQRSVALLKKAIKLNYQHHWIIDNVPVSWCYDVSGNQKYCSTSFPVGCYVDKKGQAQDACVMDPGFRSGNTYYLFNHVDITIDYHPGYQEEWGKYTINSGRLITAKLEPRSIKHTSLYQTHCESDERMAITSQFNETFNITYTYSIKFRESVIKWSSRWDYILDSLPNRNILWFNAVNSLVMILFCSGIVTVILLRILRKDYTQIDYSKDVQEKFRWMLIHGDVFRPPSKGMVLSSFLGCGIQIFLTALITLGLACVGVLSAANRGSITSCSIYSYVCLGFPAGYVSACVYKTFGGEKWRWNAFVTAFLCPGIVFALYFWMNVILWVKASSGAVPVTTLLIILALWFGISVPLTFLGAHFGAKKKKIGFPVTSCAPRKIPARPLKKCFTYPLPSYMIGGILPFGCIFIQAFFILNSIWSHQIYNMYSFLFLVFILLVITCAEVAIILCYSHLCVEDYHWMWRAFLTSGSTAIYFFIYCIHYFVSKLEISDFISIILYFSYSLVMVLLLFLLTGTVGFFACLWFVRKIYSVVDIEKIPAICDYMLLEEIHKTANTGSTTDDCTTKSSSTESGTTRSNNTET